MTARWIAIGLVLVTSVAWAGPREKMQRGLVSLLQHQTEALPGWPWVGEDERPSPNLGGVVALTLLRSYERQPNPATWITLVQYANALRRAYAPEDVLPFKADIEFLAAFGAAGLDESTQLYAAELFERVRSISPTGADEYERIATGRARVPEIIGYDIALSIRASLAVGERRYAEELADAAIRAGKLCLRDAKDSFEVTSVGALLQAVSLLPRRLNAAEIRMARDALTQAQSEAGSWATNNTQATAYAVLALSAVGAVEAATRGRAWLLERQLKSGAWAAYHDGLPEPFVGPVIPLVEAEAYAALLASR